MIIALRITMKYFRIILCLATVTLWLAPLRSPASACPPVVKRGAKKIIAQEKAELDLPLSPLLQAKLREHPIFQWAQSIPDQGKGLYFFFARGFAANEAMQWDNTADSSDEWAVDPAFKGEGQQGLMIKKYLEFLLPQA